MTKSSAGFLLIGFGLGSTIPFFAFAMLLHHMFIVGISTRAIPILSLPLVAIILGAFLIFKSRPKHV